MFQKYIVPAIGVGAFIVGGLVAREKAVEVVDIVTKALTKVSNKGYIQ
jgi:hypothetical protein